MSNTEVIPLTESFVKIFDMTAEFGKDFTIQNNTQVDIVFLQKDTTPVVGEKGLILGAGKSGAVLDINEDIYFRATNSRGATLTIDERV